jgi:hypothetical protein
MSLKWHLGINTTETLHNSSEGPSGLLEVRDLSADCLDLLQLWVIIIFRSQGSLHVYSQIVPAADPGIWFPVSNLAEN